MQLKSILLGASFILAAAAATIIPKGTPDGIYHSVIDSSGKETAVKLDPSETLGDSPFAGSKNATSISARSLVRRVTTHCDPQTLSASDITAASYVVKQTCGDGHFLMQGTWAWVHGSVVFYICSYPVGGFNCTASAVDFSNTQITNGCGTNRGGWASYTTPTPSGTSFGRRVFGQPFC